MLGETLCAKAVEARFTQFTQRHNPNSMQQRFLTLLQNHIAKYGAIEVSRLYEAPFTTINAQGLDGVFEDEAQIDDLIAIIKSFRPAKATDGTSNEAGTGNNHE